MDGLSDRGSTPLSSILELDGKTLENKAFPFFCRNIYGYTWLHCSIYYLFMGNYSIICCMNKMETDDRNGGR